MKTKAKAKLSKLLAAFLSLLLVSTVLISVPMMGYAAEIDPNVQKYIDAKSVNEMLALLDAEAASTSPTIDIGAYKIFASGSVERKTIAGKLYAQSVNFKTIADINGALSSAIGEVTKDSSSGDSSGDTSGAPSLAVRGTTIPVMQAGQTQTLSFDLENYSGYNATKTTIHLSSEDKALNIKSYPDISISNFNNGSINSITPTIEVPISTKTGRYELKLAVTNTDDKGTSSPQSLSIYIDVVNNNAMTGLIIENYTLDKASVGANEAFSLTVTVKNPTRAKITGSKLTLGVTDGKTFAMQSGVVEYKLFDIDPGATATIQFPLTTVAEVTTGTYTIPLNLEYTDPTATGSAAEPAKTSATAFIPVKGKAAGTDTKAVAPTIIINKYDFGGTNVQGGKTFTLKLDILNTSTVAGIKNLKITIAGATTKDAGVVFTPANSSNTFFVEKLASRETKQLSIDLLPKSDAAPDSYGIDVSFSFEYVVEGQTYKPDNASTETIAIPLQQEDRFTVNEPELQQQAFIGQTYPINVSFVNQGKSKIYNLSVDVEGNFEKTASAYYVGNLDAGAQDMFDTNVIPTEEGEMKGTIIFTYEDANGNKQELRKEFTATAMQMEMPTDGKDGLIIDDPSKMEGQGGIPVWVFIIIGVVVLGGGGTGVFFFLKRRNAKKKAELEDEDI